MLTVENGVQLGFFNKNPHFIFSLLKFLLNFQQIPSQTTVESQFQQKVNKMAKSSFLIDINGKLRLLFYIFIEFMLNNNLRNKERRKQLQQLIKFEISWYSHNLLISFDVPIKYSLEMLFLSGSQSVECCCWVLLLLQWNNLLSFYCHPSPPAFPNQEEEFNPPGNKTLSGGSYVRAKAGNVPPNWEIRNKVFKNSRYDEVVELADERVCLRFLNVFMIVLSSTFFRLGFHRLNNGFHRLRLWMSDLIDSDNLLVEVVLLVSNDREK